MYNKNSKLSVLGIIAGLLISNNVTAGCADLPDHATLTTTLKASVLPSGGPTNGGFDLNMWLTTVDSDGVVCNITFTGGDRLGPNGLAVALYLRKKQILAGLSAFLVWLYRQLTFSIPLSRVMVCLASNSVIQ